MRWTPGVKCRVCYKVVNRRRHGRFPCYWIAWRYYRRTGITPMTRYLLEVTPPDQVTFL